MKIKIKDINGNWVWYDTEIKQTTSAEVQQGTIRNDAVKSVGADTSTKRGRVMTAHNQTQSLLVKDGFKANVPADLKLQYATEIQRLQSLRGTPTLKDYNYLEGITGLKTGVTTQDIKTQLSNQLKLAESSKIPIGQLTEDSYKKTYSFTFPNWKEIDGIKALRGWNNLMNRQSFNKVQYDPATYAEDIWAKQNG